MEYLHKRVPDKNVDSDETPRSDQRLTGLPESL